MVYLKNAEELQLMRNSSKVLAEAHGEVAKLIRPGVKTSELDKRAEEFIHDNNGYPSFINSRHSMYHDFVNRYAQRMWKAFVVFK